MSAGEDQSDVDRVLAGDLSAFEGIVRRWQGPLVNLAYRFCHDRSRAEDMAQDAFLRAYRHLRTWRRDAAFSSWLFALATNLYRSELKKIPANLVPLEDVGEPRDPVRLDSNLEIEIEARVLRDAVRALPLKYREVLVVYYFHEMDVPAAAQSLGLPAGTLKARLHRAREILRKKLTRVLPQPCLKEAR